MHNVVTRTSRGPRSILLRASVCIAVQSERSGKLILSVEREVAIAHYRFRRVVTLPVARPVVE
jgi:hypothetical protein